MFGNVSWKPAVLLLIFSQLAPAAEPAGDGWFTQQPTVAPAQVRPQKENQPSQQPEEAYPELNRGPKPTWIWGADDNTRYVLRRRFPGGSQQARLKATCDNRMSLFLNGKKVAQNDRWESPVERDVQKFLKPGENVLTAEVANAGGPAGFALKLALSSEEGESRYIVSDASWQAAEDRSTDQWVAVRTLGKMGTAPWNDVFSQPRNLPQTERNVFQLPPGFQVELLYTVPKKKQGSWVAITFDDQGRLIASDQQNKGLCRVTPPPIGSDEPTRVEPLEVDITAAQGMLYAFDSLYLSVNGGPGSGFYRAKDTDGDDHFEEVEKLKNLRGGGEHGPHSVRLGPDGESLYVIAGNHTHPPKDFEASRLPSNWDEDLLLPRQWDARGHARGRLAPGGWIAKTDPDAQQWEIVSSGYRNSYDMAFNAEGELFAYDADMEWDMGMPWYRPTRVVHAASGSEFGWRSGTGKWPPYYLDSLPPVRNIGPGSPTGVTFGYGTRFPARYQKALFLCDWTFGTIYALHLKPEGSSYSGRKEEFLSRTPLPLTDIAVGPDGALYFTIGGRGTQSALFRVTYTGDKSTEPAQLRDEKFADLRRLRRKLEDDHHRAESPGKAVDFIYPHLGHADRFIRYAARVALENQPTSLWQDRVLSEADPERLINGAAALARQGDAALQPRLIEALLQIDFGRLSEMQKLELLRAWSLVFIRMGEPDETTARQLAGTLDAHYPAETDRLNRELSRMLVYLRHPTVIEKTIALMKRERQPATPAEKQELLARNPGYGGTIAQMLANRPDAQKLHYAFVLRNLKKGWTLEQKKFYFRFLQKARGWSGGASYEGFLKNIGDEAFENSTEQHRLAIEAAGIRKPFQVGKLPQPQGPGRDWTLSELLEIAENGLDAGRNYKNGRKMFAAARCIVCHRFAGEGGATGPDLSQAAGRFNLQDLCEALVKPSKDISDQYQATTVATSDGKVYTGQILAEADGTLRILTDPEDPTEVVAIPQGKVLEKRPSPKSLMPEDLLDSLNKQEVLDLLAYLLSRGNPNDAMFGK